MLKILKKDTASGPVIHLEGGVDERAELARIIEEAQGSQSVGLNCRKIERFSSAGIRQWIRFFGETTKRMKLEVKYLECSAAMIESVNTYLGFLAGGAIESFEIPLFCSNCKSEWALVETIQNAKARTIQGLIDECNQLKCGKCDHHLLINALEDEYFRFLRREMLRTS